MKKQELLEFLDQMPDEIDPERLMDELYVRAKIDRAETAIARGEVVDHEEVLRRSREWFQSNGQDQR